MKTTDYIGKIVKVIIDRPLGSKHPKYDYEYPVNYGYVPNTKSGDGEELDVYVLSVFEPLNEYTGQCIAVIHRTDDDDDKLIVVPEGVNLEDVEIEKAVAFQEKWFKHILLRKNTAIIRKFAKEDLSQVLDLCREIRQYHNDLLDNYFTPQNDEFEKIGYLESLENDNTIALVAEYNKKIVGVLLGEFKVSPWMTKSKIAHIANIGINKENRRKGIGEQLIKTFFDICKDKGVDEIRLGVYNKNINAYKFYESYGFVPLQQTMILDINKNN